MINVPIVWKSKGQKYIIALYILEDKKARALIEVLNSISNDAIDPDKVLSRWPLGDQEVEG